MGRKLLKAAIVAAALSAVLSVGPSAAAPLRATTGNCIPGAWGTLRPDLASAALDLVNVHRTGMGLAALKVSPRLTASADWKSLHMGFYGYFDHYDWNYPTQGVN